jgi:hypothetical protein
VADLTRRSIFPLAGVTAITPLIAGGATAQPVIDPLTWGLQISLRWQNYRDGWYVSIIDWDNLPEYWNPGMVPMFKHVPLAVYLAEVEEKLKLRPANASPCGGSSPNG